MSKVVVLSFSKDEEEACQRMLRIISESPNFEGCNVLQVKKYLSIGGMKLNLAEKNVVIHGAEVKGKDRGQSGQAALHTDRMGHWLSV